MLPIPLSRPIWFSPPVQSALQTSQASCKLKCITHNAMEAPYLRVSRSVSACARCRSAKVKCDGRLPSCTACERAGRQQECSRAGGPGTFAKGKERSYVASLEAKIEKLELEIARCKEQAQISRAPQSAPNATTLRPQRRDALDVDDLVADFGYL